MGGVGVAELVVLGVIVLVPAAVAGVLGYLFFYKAKSGKAP